MAEENVRQCVRSNIIGTLNLLQESMRGRQYFFVFISSDKASRVRGIYGATKYIGEKLVQEFGMLNPHTKYNVIRYGNVLGSTGSVIEKWRPLIQAGKPVIITDAAATRYFFSVKDAVTTIFDSMGRNIPNPIIPKMQAATMGFVLECCQQVWGKCPVKTIGLQIGENMHETLDGENYSDAAEKWTKEGFFKEFFNHE